jgi:aminoglycoside 3-N-acetyltransferase
LANALMIVLTKRVAKRCLRPVTNPWLSRKRIARDLLKVGVRPDGILLVHSSLSSLGYVLGGPATVIRALLDALGPEGTLVMPTHTFRQMNEGSRTFDARETCSCVGTLTEVFRRWPGAQRSLHPTHSVAAVGPLAGQLVEGHEAASTPCGDGTPYAKILERDGKVLLLGVGLKNHTAFHTVEAMASVPYLMNRQAEDFTLIDAQGRKRHIPVFRHVPRIARCFPDTEEFLAGSGALAQGRVGPANCLLVQGRVFLRAMIDKLRVDPTFLLAKPAQTPC